jgi:uncharacterized protein (DUF433 family)
LIGGRGSGMFFQMDSNAFDDARITPSFGLAEAAHYLRINPSTLRTWTGTPALIKVLSAQSPSLSFINLVEAFVLSSIRYKHGVSLQKIRAALDYVERTLEIAHPLANARFLTDGSNLFVEQFGKFISASESGQTAMRSLLNAYLQRVEHDETGMASRFYPWTRRGESASQPKLIVIDPYVSFGRPCVAGTGVPTAAVAERYKAGESIDDLADDYGISRHQVEEAVRCEFDRAA